VLKSFVSSLATTVLATNPWIVILSTTLGAIGTLLTLNGFLLLV
jgi:hypothetical protein